MFWDDIKLVTEKVQSYGLRLPLADLGGVRRPCIADYDLTIATGEQSARYVTLEQRPFDHLSEDYLILNPEEGDPFIEDLPYQYRDQFGTALCLNVLEHVRNPFRVMAALYQVLQPGGVLILETVFSFPYHPSPDDNWRFSPGCLHHLATDAGFTVLECDWRLTVTADRGILNRGNGEPVEIRSVYAVLSKGPLSPSPRQSFDLPRRRSENERANQIIGR